MTDMIDYPHELVAAATLDLMRVNVRIFQGYRLGDTDERHVGALMSYMALPQNAVIADIGSGIGGMAATMRYFRPDLRFHLINNNEFQQGYTSEVLGVKHVADMHLLPLPSASVDVAMFCYSLCHGVPVLALSEAQRVTRPGGHLFVYDYERHGGDANLALKLLAARFVRLGEMPAICAEAGWTNLETIYPEGDDSLWRDLCGDQYDALFDGLRPVIWKAVKPC